jgi:hypothetical protein
MDQREKLLAFYKRSINNQTETEKCIAPNSSSQNKINDEHEKLLAFYKRTATVDSDNVGVPETSALKTDQDKPLRKKKSSWRSYAKRKLSRKKILQELELWSRCCTQLCLNLLTWTLVLQCRTQYVGLETTADRRSWLEKQMDAMEIGPSSFSYQLPVVDSASRKCCAKAWRFAYGVPPATHKRAMSNRSQNKNGNSPGPAKRKRASQKGATRSVREQTFISWLLDYAKTATCKLPHSDQHHATLRLPFHSKRLLHNVYSDAFANGPTELSPLDYTRMVRVWKQVT